DASLGAATHTLGNWIAAVFGITGGIAYALAAGTALFTDALNLLFPAAAGIAGWAIFVGIGILRSQPRPVVAVQRANEREPAAAAGSQRRAAAPSGGGTPTRGCPSACASRCGRRRRGRP